MNNYRAENMYFHSETNFIVHKQYYLFSSIHHNNLKSIHLIYSLILSSGIDEQFENTFKNFRAWH